MGDQLSGTESALARMRDALARLAHPDVLYGAGFDAALRAVVETSAEAMQVERVGYWSVEHAPTRIRLVDLFERSLGRHTSGIELAQADFPAYFEALATRRPVALDDARTDPRSAAFTDAYLAPHGITSMLDVQVHAGGRWVGVVCHEHVGPARAWTMEEQQFAQTVSDLLTLAMEIRERRKAEAELTRTKDTLESLINLLPLALVRVDANSRVTLWNRAAERLFGWTEAEVLGGRAPMIPADREAEFQHALRETMESGARLAFESVRMRKDGTPVEVGIWSATDAAHGAMAVFADLTARRETERALRDSEAHWRSLVTNAPAFILAVDRAGHMTFINRTAPDLEMADILGRPIYDYADQPETIRAAIDRVFSTGHSESYQVSRSLPDGTKGWYQTVASPVFDEKGEVERALLVATDITEMVHAREALRVERDRARAYLDIADVMILALDSDGKVTLMNRRGCDTLGTTEQAIIGADWYARFVPEALRAQLRASFDRMIGGEAPLAEHEYPILTSRGDQRLVAFHKTPLRNERGEVTGLLASGQDVTERRRAEAALVASEARLRAVIDRAIDAIVLMDHAGKVVEFNPSAEVMFGWRRDEIIGKEMAEHIVPERLRDRHRRGLARVLATGQSKLMDRRVEMPGLRRSGDEFPVELAIVRVPDVDPPLFAGFLRDLTEQRAAEAEIHDHRERLEGLVAARTTEIAAVNRELEAFAYSVSHDLRAPLRSIDGFSEALMEDYGGQLDATGRDYLERLRGSSLRMGSLIDSLLHLSRVTRGDMARELVDLSAIAKSVASELQRTAPDRKVQVTIAPGVTGWGDPALLRIVLDNLLGNAWKFTSRHPSAHIEFGVTERSGQRAYFVRDDGAGFDPAHASKLFTVFQRLHTSAEFEGSGIGLATVQRIVHRHGGHLGAEGAVEKGATFWFTLGAPSQ